MSNRKDRENMNKLDRCYKVVLQSRAKGIRADEIAGKLGVHRTTVYNYLGSLQLMGKVESEQGIWRAKTGEQTIKPLEKEIVIELPMPENKWLDMARLELLANYGEDVGYSKVAKMLGTIIEKFNETRTIKIKGKNVDDLDLEKLGNLIQQANKKSSKVNLRSLFKSLKKSRPDNSQGQ
jgi:sugar-specific transcriptional regulator TrmB